MVLGGFFVVSGWLENLNFRLISHNDGGTEEM
jgi:hypothetical protein